MTIMSIISEAANIVRYNPPLAIQWLEEARSRVMTTKEIEYYNKKVDEVNKHLDNLEKKRYYKRDEIWGDIRGKTTPRASKIEDYGLEIDLSDAEKIEELVNQGKL